MKFGVQQSETVDEQFIEYSCRNYILGYNIELDEMNLDFSNPDCSLPIFVTEI